MNSCSSKKNFFAAHFTNSLFFIKTEIDVPLLQYEKLVLIDSMENSFVRNVKYQDCLIRLIFIILKVVGSNPTKNLFFFFKISLFFHKIPRKNNRRFMTKILFSESLEIFDEQSSFENQKICCGKVLIISGRHLNKLEDLIEAQSIKVHCELQEKITCREGINMKITCFFDLLDFDDGN
jgi:hypothetical protein